MDAMTPLANVCDILGQIWIEYKEEAEFADFIEYNDIGLPLAYSISEGIIETAPLAEQYIMETWAILLDALGLEDTGVWEALDELLESAVKGMGE